MGITEEERRSALHALSSTVPSWTDRDTTPEQCSNAPSPGARFCSFWRRWSPSGAWAPGDDLVSDLIRLMDADVGLSVEEILYNWYSLFLGRNEEPRFALA
jgi:hypothetical protein